MKLIKCKYCNGSGGKDIGAPCSPKDTMWVDGGESMELSWEDCKVCNGTGQIVLKNSLT